VKKLGIFFLGCLLYAAPKVDLLFSMLKFNYKEYKNSQVLDKDTSNFSDLGGISFSLTDYREKSKFRLDLEYNSGTTNYDGSTWGGTPLKLKKKNVYLFNSKVIGSYLLGEDFTSIGMGKFYFSLGLGYRFWHRGKSDYSGDYNENYKWAYYTIGFDFNDYFEEAVEFSMNIYYHQAISPTMKAYLGSGDTYHLGNTDGYRFEFPLRVYFWDDSGFEIKYIYDYWHIRKSDTQTITFDDGSTVLTYEPESKTRNNYLNIGFFFNF